MEFPKQEYWSGLPFPSPGDLPDPGIKPGSPALQAYSLPSEPPGSFQMWAGNGAGKERMMACPGVFYSKETACIVGDPGLIPGSGRSPGEGNGNPLQYSCLRNPMDRGASSMGSHSQT